VRLEQVCIIYDSGEKKAFPYERNKLLERYCHARDNTISAEDIGAKDMDVYLLGCVLGEDSDHLCHKRKKRFLTRDSNFSKDIDMREKKISAEDIGAKYLDVYFSRRDQTRS
jgi:hypothetical protein